MSTLLPAYLPATLLKLGTTFGSDNISPELGSEKGNLSDFIAMDGGAYLIGEARRPNLIKLFVNLQTAKDYEFALVPVIDEDPTIFFADIGYLPQQFKLHDFLEIVVKCFSKIAVKYDEEPITANDVIVFKREIFEKYHIYIEYTVSWAVRRVIWAAINEECGDDIIDMFTNTIRIEGFNKYNRIIKGYVAKSRYIPIGAAKELTYEELYNKVWLNPRGWTANIEDAAGAGLLNDCNVASDNKQGVARAGILNDGDDEKSESKAGSPEIHDAIIIEGYGDNSEAAGDNEVQDVAFNVIFNEDVESIDDKAVAVGSNPIDDDLIIIDNGQADDEDDNELNHCDDEKDVEFENNNFVNSNNILVNDDADFVILNDNDLMNNDNAPGVNDESNKPATGKKRRFISKETDRAAKRRRIE